MCSAGFLPDRPMQNQTQCPPLTLGKHKSYKNNRMIHLTDCLDISGAVISDYNKRLILLSAIQLRGGHCITFIKI